MSALSSGIAERMLRWRRVLADLTRTPASLNAELKSASANPMPASPVPNRPREAAAPVSSARAFVRQTLAKDGARGSAGYAVGSARFPLTKTQPSRQGLADDADHSTTVSPSGTATPWRLLTAAASAILFVAWLPGCSETQVNSLVFASELSGRLVHQGRPLSGVRLVRIVKDASETATDEVTTGADGSFAFPAAPRKRSLLMRLVPGEVLSSVSVQITWQGRQIELLGYTKRDYQPLSEFGGRAVRFELDPGEVRYDLDFGDGTLSRKVTARLAPDAHRALGSVVIRRVDEAAAERLQRLFQ
ncbi:MAG: hypothetical protein N3F11_03290 [Casimicrobiaceae bacterium]|nr:hypothetical protein [Casimicrobiaceae bacterium]